VGELPVKRWGEGVEELWFTRGEVEVVGGRDVVILSVIRQEVRVKKLSGGKREWR